MTFDLKARKIWSHPFHVTNQTQALLFAAFSLEFNPYLLHNPSLASVFHKNRTEPGSLARSLFISVSIE